MTSNAQDAQTLLQQQAHIQRTIAQRFAPEDEGLLHALSAAQNAGLPAIQVSPIQGKLLSMLATLCQAQKILEIGSLAGYSGIWLARALPANGRLISLEINPKNAGVIRDSFAHAGVAQKTEVRVGNALELLPTLQSEAPFDLIFIDADKPAYLQYLDWSLRLTRPGSIIVADNTIRMGERLRDPSQVTDKNDAAVAAYNQRILDDPRLLSLALAMDDEYTDGFTIAIVRAGNEGEL
jgi:caffeoyl-CoA O-methyltransferase